MGIAAEWAGQLHLRQNDEDSNGDDDDDDANDGDDDDDDANDDDDDIGREFFSPAPISLTGNYWPRWFSMKKKSNSPNNKNFQVQLKFPCTIKIFRYN